MAVCNTEPRRGHIGVPARSGATGWSAALLFATRSSRHIKVTRPGVTGPCVLAVARGCFIADWVADPPLPLSVFDGPKEKQDHGVARDSGVRAWVIAVVAESGSLSVRLFAARKH